MPSLLEISQQSETNHMHLTPSPELLTNIFRVESFDAITEQIAQRLLAILQGDSLEMVEIEAKFGILKDKKGPRWEIHEANDGIVVLRHSPMAPYYFLTEIQQAHWNNLQKLILNGRCENFKQFQYEPRIDYLYTETVDEFYAGADQSQRIRVTKDVDTGEVLECICKEEIGFGGANINILNNRQLYDCRISAKRETQIELSDIPGYLMGTASVVAQPRRKCRHSYAVGLWSIDLTELPPLVQNQSESTYEIEIELRSEFIPMLKQAIDDLKFMRNKNFYKIVRSLMDTIRTLLVHICDVSMPPLLCTNKPLHPHVAKKIKRFDETSSSTVVQLSGYSGESRM